MWKNSKNSRQCMKNFFYQVKPKAKLTIHNLSYPQREKTRRHVVPTEDGTYKLGHAIYKKKKTNRQSKQRKTKQN